MQSPNPTIALAPASSVKLDSDTLHYFEPHHYETIRALCEAIIPPEADSGGATDAGVPEFIDLLVSENRRYQSVFTAGLDWLERTCTRLYGSPYLECLPAQRESIMERIAFRGNGTADDELESGTRFFALLRKLTVGGFFTSRIGIECLNYIGNESLVDFPGCPVPDGWPEACAVGSLKKGDPDG